MEVSYGSGQRSGEVYCMYRLLGGAKGHYKRREF